jgi:hypothetical protein
MTRGTAMECASMLMDAATKAGGSRTSPATKLATYNTALSAR